MTAHDRDDDSDTDWDSIYDEGPPEHVSEQPGSVSQGPPSAKAREAAEETREGDTSQGSVSQAQRPSQPASRWANEETPLLDAGPPPPAYSDITASPYRNNSGRPPSQSMHERTASDGGEAGQASADDSMKKRGRYRRFTRPRMLLKLAIFILGLVLITTLVGTTWHDSTHPQKDQPGHEGDDDSNTPVTPPPSDLWSSPRLDGCSFEAYSLNHFFEFSSPQSFSFLELMEDSGLDLDEIDGLVKVMESSGGQTAAIVVGISLGTTSPYEVTQINVKQTEDSLSLKAPTLTARGSGSGKSCMIVVVNIYVRSDIDISDIEIATRHLNIKIDSKGDTFDIKGTTELTTIRGNVDVDHWSSRTTIIDVVSGSISGTYALQDLLSVKSRSGTISIDVKPEAVDKRSPAPAEFVAATNSGSIGVHFPVTGNDEDIPEREYHTRVESNSGSISGSYILGSSSTFKTTSASISADILPYSADMFASSLRTETYSGHTSINMLSPFRDRGRPITRFHSTHKTISAAVNLVYPQEWEGAITSDSISGNLVVQGRDVKVISYHNEPGHKGIYAKKGNGNSKLDMSSISGSLTAKIGY